MPVCGDRGPRPSVAAMETASLNRRVGPEHTARVVGSGDLDVLATPLVIAWLEAATCAALELDEGSTSVGVRVDVEHLAASPIGSLITVTASVRHREDRKVEFEVAALDDRGTTVAQGTIQRVIVDRERFIGRLPDVGN